MSEAVLRADPDIVEETKALSISSSSPCTDHRASESSSSQSKPFRFIPLQLIGGSFQGTHKTAELLEEIGGLEALKSITSLFYAKCFEDSHLDQFIANHNGYLHPNQFILSVPGKHIHLFELFSLTNTLILQ